MRNYCLKYTPANLVYALASGNDATMSKMLNKSERPSCIIAATIKDREYSNISESNTNDFTM